MSMRVILSTLVLLAIVAVLVLDGVSMYDAHRQADNFAKQAADQAAHTFVVTKGNEEIVHNVVEDMATSEGAELVDLSYHKGTTRWYEVTVRVQSGSILLKHVPYFKNRLAQECTTIEHF